MQFPMNFQFDDMHVSILSKMHSFCAKIYLFSLIKMYIAYETLFVPFSLNKRENIEYPHKRTKSQKFYFYKDLKRKNVDQICISIEITTNSQEVYV